MAGAANNQSHRVADLYHYHHRDLARFFAGRLSDHAACEDLCQDVFLRLLLAEAAGVLPEKPQAWLKRVASNLLVDTYRRRAVAETHLAPLPADDEIPLFDFTVPWDDLDHQELGERIAATFRTLPVKSRRLLYWRAVEGLATGAIAERLGASPAVVATELSRARARFRREYLRLHASGVLEPDEEIFEDPAALLSFDPLMPADELVGAVQMRVRAYFDRIAPTWESYVATAYETNLAARLSHLLPWHPGMRVLDVGTGTGYLARILAPAVGEMIGVDASPEMLRQAGERSSSHDVPNLALRQGTAERLPVADGTVDVALCHMLLHHVVSPRQVLRELRRVVRPGGYLVIVDADRHDLPWTIEEFGDVHKGTDRRRLQRHLAAAGFVVERLEDAGISASGVTVGRRADFTNFLLLGRAGAA